MSDMYWDVKSFHRKFDIEHGEANVDMALGANRLVLIQEEFNEYKEAYTKALAESEGIDFKPNSEMLDALIDLLWVTLGACDAFGLPLELGWEEVKRANMSKRLAKDASESTRAYTRDVVKPKDFIPPNMERVLRLSPPKMPLKPSGPKRV